MINWRNFLGAIALMACLPSSMVADQTVSSFATALPSEAVFKSGEEGYHTFRIPAIVKSAKGTLVAFAEGRVNNSGDHGNIDIVARRSTDGGKTWGKFILVQDDGLNQCGNPAPVVDETTGRIFLLSCGSTASEGEVMDDKATREVYMQFSDDDGKTWSPRKNISNQGKRSDWRWYATGPCSGIQIVEGKYKGRLVVPANHSDAERVYRSHCLYSDDHGESWQLGSTAGDGSNESQIAEVRPDMLVHNMRMQTHGKGFRGVRYSRDGGETWSDLEHEEGLVCPRCQGSIVRDYGKEKLLFFSNPAAIPRARRGMTIKASLDGGKTWPYGKPVYDGPSGYSNLVVVTDRTIGILFEAGDNDIAEGIFFASFPFEDILASEK